jgi:MFS family permease
MNTKPSPKRPSGMLGLTIVLAGQAVSILASSMTGFALSIWVFQQTSSATSLGIMQSAFTLPYLLIIPLAGVLVDRYKWKFPPSKPLTWSCAPGLWKMPGSSSISCRNPTF